MATNILPFPPAVYDPRWVTTDTQLQNKIDTVCLDSRFKSLGVAVVNMTEGRRALAVSVKGRDMFLVGSLSKITLLYVAFELRSAVLKASEVTSPSVGPDKFISDLEKEWSDPIKKSLSKYFIPRLTEKQWPTKLNLKAIFSIKVENGQWKIKFQSDGKSHSTLDGFHKKDSVANLLFLEKLKLAIGWSDNLGADGCIQALGFPYIAACLVRGGFFDNPADRLTPSTNSKSVVPGYWLGRHFTEIASDDVKKNFLPADQKKIKDFDLWSGAPGVVPATGHGASAIAAARLMTLIATDGFVRLGPGVTSEMAGFLSKLA